MKERGRSALLPLPAVQLSARPAGSSRAGARQLHEGEGEARARSVSRQGLSPAPQARRGEDRAKLYAMVTNIDTNIGRLLKAVEERGIAESTIVVFLTDNGPAFPAIQRRAARAEGIDLRGRDPGSLLRPLAGPFPAGREVDQARRPHRHHADPARRLPGVRRGRARRSTAAACCRCCAVTSVAWPERTLYFQWHRGDVPELGRAFAAPDSAVQAPPSRAAGNRSEAGPWSFMTCEQDPYEQTNLAAKHPEIVARMYHDYLDWFRDVCSDARIRADPDPGRRPAGESHPAHSPGLAPSRRANARPGRFLGARGDPSRPLRDRCQRRAA